MNERKRKSVETATLLVVLRSHATLPDANQILCFAALFSAIKVKIDEKAKCFVGVDDGRGRERESNQVS